LPQGIKTTLGCFLYAETRRDEQGLNRMSIVALKAFAANIIYWGALFLLFILGLGVLLIVLMYFIDKRQTTHTIRRNYPVVGRFRYIFEHLGEFFRQYFFAMDREELPFNRAERKTAILFFSIAPSPPLMRKHSPPLWLPSANTPLDNLTKPVLWSISRE